MNYKPMRPFIVEFLLVILYIIALSALLPSTGFVIISVQLNLPMIAFVVILSFGIFSFSRICNVGSRAIIDRLLHLVATDVYQYADTLPSRYSSLMDKFDRSGIPVVKNYYLVQMKQKGKIYTFFCPEYQELSKGHHYRVCCGRYSRILLTAEVIPACSEKQ